MKYILAYTIPSDSFVSVECLTPDEALLRLNEMFSESAGHEFDSIDDVLDSFDYEEIDISTWYECVHFTIATTNNEILYTS